MSNYYVICDKVDCSPGCVHCPHAGRHAHRPACDFECPADVDAICQPILDNHPEHPPAKYNLNKAYSKKFFAQRKALQWRCKEFVNAVLKYLNVQSVVDLGCGNGDLLAEFKAHGCFVMGIEGTANCIDTSLLPLSCLYIHDLREPLTTGPGLLSIDLSLYFDLAMCLEVAEHLEPQYAQTLIDNICSLSSRVLFSAAKPGQGGTHHHNCADPDYWSKLFYTHGYVENADITRLIREDLVHKHKKGIKAYYQNMRYYVKVEQ